MLPLLRTALVAAFLVPLTAGAEAPPLREEARVRDEIRDQRISSLLPGLMTRTGIDMWIVVSREYNEDPLIKTLLPATWLHARRRTILVFTLVDGKVEAKAIARYDVSKSIPSAWDQTRHPDQWQALAAIVTAKDPKRIGINVSTDFEHADGLDHTDYLEMTAALGDTYRGRIVSSESLAVAWAETRTAPERDLHARLAAETHRLIDEGFSTKAITPGKTTSDDLVWWLRERIRSLGYGTWFHPTIEIERKEGPVATLDGDTVIQPGDLLHVDIGLSAWGLNSDIQRHAYVLRPGETAAPAGLVAAFSQGNRAQDILTGSFRTGLTGNQILKNALTQAKQEGLRASIYSHPLGFHGHAAGPSIGMWDQQGGVKGTGDYPLNPNTAYAIELGVTVHVPEWGKDVHIKLEEDGFFDGTTVTYLDPRQTAIRLIQAGK